MPLGSCNIFGPPGVHRGGAQGAEFGVSEGANYSFEFCTFLVPIPDSYHPILRVMVCKNFRPHLHTLFHTRTCANVHIFAQSCTSAHMQSIFAHDRTRSPASVRMCEILHSRMCANVQNFTLPHILKFAFDMIKP